MKELTIGEISIYTEDGEEWNEILEVVKKAKSIHEGEKTGKTWIEKALNKIFPKK